MNHFQTFLDALANGNGVYYVKPILSAIFGIIGLIIFWWFYRVVTILRAFFKNVMDVIGGEYAGHKPSVVFLEKRKRWVLIKAAKS